MKNVKMEKIKLIEILKTNMEVHVREYNEMMEIYMTQAIIKAKEMVKDLENGDTNTSLSVQLEKPRNSEKSYQNALEMLDYEIDDNVVLEAREFKQLVKDEWDFSRSFAMSKAAYLGLD